MKNKLIAPIAKLIVGFLLAVGGIVLSIQGCREVTEPGFNEDGVEILDEQGEVVDFPQ